MDNHTGNDEIKGCGEGFDLWVEWLKGQVFFGFEFCFCCLQHVGGHVCDGDF